MRREAILHIGPMKTGTTSIQAWLRRNRDALNAHGCHFPADFGAANMSKIAQVADLAADGEPMAPDLAARWNALTAEIAALPQTVGRVVISGEMMGQHLRRPRQVAALKRLLDPMFERYRVVVYLRRQDEVSVSMYNTRVRHRATSTAAVLSDPMDYAALLEAWATVFGREAIVPRLFARTELVGNDVVADFAAAIGLPAGAIDTSSKVRNASYTPAAQAFLSQLYATAAAHGRRRDDLSEDDYNVMIHALNRNFVGPGLVPSRDEALAFLRKVEVANEIVRRTWFPDRARLFSDDLSRYPEARPADPGPDEVLEVALTVVGALLTAQARRPRPLDDGDADAGPAAVATGRPVWDTGALPFRGGSMSAEGEGKTGGAKVRPSKAEARVVSKVARALWRVANQATIETLSTEERKTRWQAEKKPFVAQSRKVLRSLRKDGLDFTVTKPLTDDETDLDSSIDETKEPPRG